MITWDKYNSARLAESVDTRGEDPCQMLEIQYRDSFFLGTNPPELKERTYDLRVFVGDDDMAFSGLSARQICQIAEGMIKLVGGSFRIEPPDDPEIKF